MSASGDLHYDRYATHEWRVRIGTIDAPPILLLPPLFEEMNRTRALLVAVMRRLARAGFCCWLPDLPGTGESERSLDTVGWDDWQGAVVGLANDLDRPAIASFRGGCLLDPSTDAGCRWRLAPVDGASLVRDLGRAGMMTGGGNAGYPIGDAFLSTVAEAKPPALPHLRTARLSSDRAEADARIEGTALWRRSEPGNDASMANAIAVDIADWVRACAAC